MKIAVLGSGGVGGYFGAKLAAAGLDVGFLARGAHLAAIRENGLEIRSASTGDVHVRPARASDEAGEIGPVDIVLFATKLWDVESAGEACRALIGPETAVISLLNGIDSEHRLIAILGADHVVGGVAYISGGIVAPGVVQHFAIPPAIAFGELDGARSPRLRAFDEAAREAGIDARLSGDIWDLIWRKFVFLATMAGVTALTRQTIGPIREDPVMRQLFADAAEEVVRVAAAEGHDLGDEAANIVAVADKMAPGTRASMAMDLEQGKRLEVEWLSGAVWRLAEKHGLAAPLHRVMYAALKPWAEGRVGER